MIVAVTGCGSTPGPQATDVRASPVAVVSEPAVTDAAERASASAPSTTSGVHPAPSTVVAPTVGPGRDPSSAPPSAPHGASRAGVPLVPVTGFWSAERSISRAAVAAAVAGRGAHARPVYVVAGYLDGLASALGVSPSKNVRELAATAIRAAIRARPAALAFLRPEDVTPDVRALRVEGAALFGVDRVVDVASWRLLVTPPVARSPEAFDPSTVWTLATGGDVMLDREVYRQAVLRGRGAGYPWDGGTAKVTARVCCGAPGQRLARGGRTPGTASVRRLLSRADLAIVNLEGPAPDRFTYHPHGLTFSMDPRLLGGLSDAGIDAVSLANNHMSNAGGAGVVETIRNVERVGLRHAGAGRNSTLARRPAWLEAAQMRVAILGYNDVARERNATATRAGAASLDLARARADIRAARRAGADLVIVVPHWGVEYTDRITDRQRRIGRGLLAAGADLVLGSHSHWAGPLELVGDRLVVYSMGDFVFDLQHDERTQEAVIVELTFVGRRLTQVELHPTLILERAQPNLLEAGGGGTRLLRAIEAASARIAR